MIKVGLVGHLMYDSGDKAVNGQAIKTRNICTMLQQRYGEENVLTLDTNYFRKSLFSKYKELIKIASTANTVVILPTANGLKLIMPVLSRMKKHYHFQILYSVIGGWLPEFLKSSDKMLKYMGVIDVIYVETRMLANQLTELGLSNVEVMPNFSIRLERAKEPIGKTQYEPPYKLCTFSRVTKKKGIGEAVECVRRINEMKGSDYCSMDIYGPLDEEYKDEFDTLIRGKADIKYCGKLDGDCIIPTLAKYDLMLFPTYYPGEGMPGAVIEAYAAKLPVVASDWHSNAEVIREGVTGKIYKLGEMDELIGATVEMLENKISLKKLSDNCFVESRKYLPDTVMQQMYNKIEEPTRV